MIKKYYRKPFIVEAVVVTEDQLPTIAKWCNGKVKGLSITLPKIRDRSKMLDAQERHSYAVIGSAIVKTNKGFIVMPGDEFYSKYATVCDVPV